MAMVAVPWLEPRGRGPLRCGRGMPWMEPRGWGSHSGVGGENWLLRPGLKEGWGEKQHLTWSSDHLPGRRF